MDFPSLHVEADVIECLDAWEFLGDMVHFKNEVIHPFHLPYFAGSCTLDRQDSRTCMPFQNSLGERASPLPGSYNDFLLVDVCLQEVSAVDQLNVDIILGDSDGNQQDRRNIHRAVIDGLGSLGER